MNINGATPSLLGFYSFYSKFDRFNTLVLIRFIQSSHSILNAFFCYSFCLCPHCIFDTRGGGVMDINNSSIKKNDSLEIKIYQKYFEESINYESMITSSDIIIGNFHFIYITNIYNSYILF